MNPRRVVEEFPLSLEAQLLRAGKAMAPLPDQVSRTLAAVGQAAAQGASGVSLGLTIKWAATGLVSGVALVAGLWGAKVVWTRSAPPSQVERATVLAEREQLSVSPRQLEQSNLQVPAQAPAESASNSVESPRLPRIALPPKATSGTLGQEVAMIDRVRAELAQQRPLQAISLLDDYARRFPDPRLAEEAAYLRATALQSAGRKKEGTTAIEEFRQRYPTSPLLPPE